MAGEYFCGWNGLHKKRSKEDEELTICEAASAQGKRTGSRCSPFIDLAQHILQRLFQIVPAKAKAGGFQALRQRALAAEHQY